MIGDATDASRPPRHLGLRDADQLSELLLGAERTTAQLSLERGGEVRAGELHSVWQTVSTFPSRLSSDCLPSVSVVADGVSQLAFPRALRKLMAEQGLSFQKLAARTQAVDGRGLGRAYLNQLATKKRQPTINNLYVIARAVDIDPRYFREYREHLAAERARELAQQIGLDEVLAKLDELQDTK